LEIGSRLFTVVEFSCVASAIIQFTLATRRLSRVGVASVNWAL